MFRAILASQWRESRLAVVILAVLAFAVPVLSLRGEWTGTDPWASWELLRAASQWGTAYPVIALVAALVLAAGAWWPDHRGKHVYALTLPVARSTYVLLRYGAGLAWLFTITCALAFGTLFATMRIALPPLLHAYPMGLTLRFFLAGMSAYTILFALNGFTPRMARYLAACILVLVIATLVGGLLSFAWNPLGAVFDALLGPHGPLAIFRARWMLIDV